MEDEARVSSLGPVLDRGDDPPAPAPGARRVVDLGEHPALRPGRLEVVPGDLARDLDLTFEHRISSLPHEVAQTVAGMGMIICGFGMSVALQNVAYLSPTAAVAVFLLLELYWFYSALDTSRLYPG